MNMRRFESGKANQAWLKALSSSHQASNFQVLWLFQLKGHEAQTQPGATGEVHLSYMPGARIL